MIVLASCGEPTPTTTTDPKPDKPETPVDTATTSLFIDVHDLEPGKVTFADVMAAHKKDLAVESK